MKLTREDLILLGNVAITAAKEAGQMITDNAGQEIEFEKKETGASLASQVVTEVDRKSQEIVLKHITPTLERFDLGLLAEESEDDLSRLAKDYFWCVDPMDGTLPFIESRPGYAVSIGFISKEGIPIIGVVYDPLTKVLYHAIKGVGIFRNEKTWKWQKPEGDTFEELDRGGAVMNACWVLENSPACFFKKAKKTNGGGCLWDYAATACLFETIGASVSDMHGNPLELNRKDSLYMNHKGVLFASNKEIANAVINNYA